MATQYSTLLVKRGSADDWSSSTVPLQSGEWGMDQTNGIVKMGDGFNLWADLRVANTSLVLDQATGLLTVSDSGAQVPSIDPATSLLPTSVMSAVQGEITALPVAGRTSGVTGLYDPARNAYNFKTSNTRRLRAGLAKAKAGAGVVKIGMCGDSTSAGYPSASVKSAPMQMRSFLEARGYPVTGTGPALANPGGSPGGYLDSRITTTGYWTTQANNANGILQSNQVGAAITFVSDRAGSVVEISYLDLGAGWKYSIDGASAVSVPASGGTGSLARVTVAGLANTTHTVTITVNSVPSGGAFYLSWFNVHNVTSGLEVGNFGVNGTTTNDWNNQTFYFPQMTLRDWAPDVVFIDLGINDWGSNATPQTAPADLKARLQSIINVFRPTSDVILVTSNPFNGIDYLPFNAVKYELAESNDIPLLDVYEMFESYTIGFDLGLFADSAHPSAAGYAAKGALLAKVIA